MISGPHRRYNPLLDEWVLCSPHRLERPWQGQTESLAEARLPAYDPSCYLCPGNARANGQRNPVYTRTFAFDNDFPALVMDAADAGIAEGGTVEGEIAEAGVAEGGVAEAGVVEGEIAEAGIGEDRLLVAEPATGRCRVVCFSPRHDLSLAEMDTTAIRGVVEAWATEVATLEADERIRYVQLFENKGAMMGCSNPHPHCQIWATGHVPLLPSRKLATQRAYFERHRRDLLGDYLESELADGERLVCRNEHWAAVVPFWAVWPFETMLVPVRRVPDLPSLEPEERDALADILKRLTVRYDNLFHCSFPYSLGWHGRPCDGGEHPWWRLHAVAFPPLLRSATVRKFLVGFEQTAEPQRDLTAERAARRLRELADEHYRRRA